MGNEKILDRISGCLIGGAAGDALGYPVEFDKLRIIKKEYGNPGITKYMINFETGTAIVSDDTQMTLFTAEGILAAMKDGVLMPRDNSIYKYVHCSYIDWYETQGRTPKKKPLKNPPENKLMDIADLYKSRAPGITCISALGNSKSRSLHKPINDSKGCGGIMRVAPVGLLYPDANLEEVVEMAAEISAITHGHPLGCFPSGIFAAIIHQAVWSNDERTLGVMIEKAVEAARTLYGKSYYWDELEDLIDKAVSFACNDRDDERNIKELGEGWVAEETLAVALYCALRYEKDFSSGIIASVNHDGDSDSTGAVTGNILGAVIGYDGIDSKWKDLLQFKNLLLHYSDLCVEAIYYL